MKSEPAPAPSYARRLLPGLFRGLFGAFLGLSLLKFGNPPIMEKWVTAPTDFFTFVLGFPWPIGWAYRLLALIAIVGLFAARWKVNAPRWLVALPLAWLIWQLLAATQSVDAQLSDPTLKHFTACVVCFYLGLLSLSRARSLAIFWLGLFCGFLLVLAGGLEQHFGGLEQSRNYFYLYIYPQLQEVPPEYVKKMSSSRIFSTLFYPNALAGVILLFLPLTLGLIGRASRYLTIGARWFVALVVSAASLACLYWSGSKGGWLLMLMLGLIALLRMPSQKQLKLAVVTGVLVVGLAGFFWKYAAFFEKGATSVGARFDYWRAAIETATEHPAFGTGPGTFAIPYQRIKRPESEMARLVHNDYLEQASDSGLPGFLLYAFFVGAALTLSFPKTADWRTFPVWLGVLGWSLQSFVEFSLYIPALSWPAFAFLGWLLGHQSRQIESTNAAKGGKVRPAR